MSGKKERFTVDEYLARARALRDAAKQLLDLDLEFRKNFGTTAPIRKTVATAQKSVVTLKERLKDEMLIDFPDLKPAQYHEHFQV